TVEVSGTVDEESGGFAGGAYLAETRRIAAGRTDYVVIPEPHSPDRICVGHRGVYWFEVTLEGRIAHGSLPFLGVSALGHIGATAGAGGGAPPAPARPGPRAPPPCPSTLPERGTRPSTSTRSRAASRARGPRPPAWPIAAGPCSTAGSCSRRGSIARARRWSS